MRINILQVLIFLFLLDSPPFVKSVVYECALSDAVHIQFNSILSKAPRCESNSDFGLQPLWLDRLIRLSRQKDITHSQTVHRLAFIFY